MKRPDKRNCLLAELLGLGKWAGLALLLLAGASCRSTQGLVNEGPGEVRFNHWFSCDPAHPETMVSRGRLRMSTPPRRVVPHPRDRDQTVFQTWLHYDESAYRIDDEMVAGSYRYGREKTLCQTRGATVGPVVAGFTSPQAGTGK